MHAVWTVLGPLLLLANPAGAAQGRRPDVVELRAALDALRAGEPGQPAFEAALPRLPELIASDSGWFVAGGAYLAGRHGRAECIPPLLAALPRNPGEREQGSILDALIRLEARVPAERLGPGPGNLPQRCLLLERDPECDPEALLELFDRAADDDRSRWRAACRLVAERDPRIAARLLLESRWELDLVVRDPGSTVAQGRGAGGSYSMYSHPPWPPFVVYELALPGPRDPLTPLGWERRESGRSLVPASAVPRAQRAALRVRLLRELLGDSVEAPLLHACEDIAIEWTGRESFTEASLGQLADLRGRLARVARGLAELGLVGDPEAVAAGVVLHVHVADLRSQDPPPLPSLPPMPGVEYE